MSRSPYLAQMTNENEIWVGKYFLNEKNIPIKIYSSVKTFILKKRGIYEYWVTWHYR